MFVLAHRRTRRMPLVLPLARAGLALTTAGCLTWTVPRLLLLLIAGAAAVTVEALATTTVQALVPPVHHGQTLGALDQLLVAGALTGTVLGPLTATAFTAPATVTGAGLLLAPAALLLLPRGRTPRPRPAPVPLRALTPRVPYR